MTTVLEMAFTGHCGVELELDTLTSKREKIAAILFNEELGAVIQVHQDATAEVLAQLSAAGLGEDCVAVIGQPINNSEVLIKFAGEERSKATVVCCSVSGLKPATRSSACVITPMALIEEFLDGLLEKTIRA